MVLNSKIELIMKFSELMLLPYNKETDIILIEALRPILTNFPDEVLQDFLSDHGRKDDFQLQYGSLDLDAIKWEKIMISAQAIIDCSFYTEFKVWFEGATYRANAFDMKGWKCIDNRPDVVAYWTDCQSWKRSPILLSSKLMQCANKYYLVEGHTRVGLLYGLVRKGILPTESKHMIWFGSIT